MKFLASWVSFAAIALFATPPIRASVLPGESFQMIDADGRVLGRSWAHDNVNGHAVAIVVNGVPAYLNVEDQRLRAIPILTGPAVLFEASDCTGPAYMTAGTVFGDNDLVPQGLIALTGTSPNHRIWLADREGSPQTRTLRSSGDPSSCSAFGSPQVTNVWPAADGGAFVARPPFRLRVEPPQVAIASSPVDAVHPVGLAFLFLMLSAVAALVWRRQG